MDEAFGNTTFEFQQYRQYQIEDFLVRFDAIFTLNQDLLLERHYLGSNVALSSGRNWSAADMPGLRPISQGDFSSGSRYLGKLAPDHSPFKVSPKVQPYFKLHGSSNWIDSNSQELIVLGGNKPSLISHHPILKWNNEQFSILLSQPNTRLMVIGYSFGDDHINGVISEAASVGNFELFIIDSLGVDVIDINRNAQIYSPGELASVLWPCMIGSSRRSLREIFGTDRAEHSKVMRFFRNDGKNKTS